MFIFLLLLLGMKMFFLCLPSPLCKIMIFYINNNIIYVIANNVGLAFPHTPKNSPVIQEHLLLISMPRKTVSVVKVAQCYWWKQTETFE